MTTGFNVKTKSTKIFFDLIFYDFACASLQPIQATPVSQRVFSSAAFKELIYRLIQLVVAKIPYYMILKQSYH